MPIELVLPIPNEISPTGKSIGSYSLDSNAFDVAIDGIPFLFGIGNDRAYVREVQDVKKPMFDNFAEPGEYSMSEWWLRSQSDFSGGMGLVYQDPSVDLRFNIKYKNSTGINPWKPGEISLLPDAITKQSALIVANEFSFVKGYFNGLYTQPRAWFTSGAKLYSYDVATDAITNVLYSGADPEATISSITSLGSTYYVITRNGIYTGTGDAAGSRLWTIPNIPGGQIAWVKGRLMAGIANKVYELVPPGGAAPFALPAAKFTHLDPVWQWTAFAEGPTSIYASGTKYPDTAIYKFVLDTTGAVPTLASGGTVAAPLPPGEEVVAMNCYLGTFIGISSNKGFRVGSIDTQGDITYGPLLWEGLSGNIVGDDRFFYVVVSNGIDLDFDREDGLISTTTTFPTDPLRDQYVCDGIYRVDLGQELKAAEGSSLRFAYSTDRFLHKELNPGTPVAGNMSLAGFDFIGERFAFAIYKSPDPLITTAGWTALWPTDREQVELVFPPPSIDGYPRMPSGVIQTGRVRFNTLEPKMFKFFSVRAPAPLVGTLAVDVISADGTPTRYIVYDATHPPDVGDIAMSSTFQPAEYVSLRFTLTRSEADSSKGPVQNGWQLKALPAPIRQRVFTMPLLCFDKEKDKTGQDIGGDGYAYERIRKMEQIAQRGYAVMLQDLYNETGDQVIIEQVQFVQTAAPGPNSASYGGYLTIKMRTVADVIT